MRVTAGEQRVLRHWAGLAALLEEHLDAVFGNFDAGIELPVLIDALVEDKQYLGCEETDGDCVVP